MTKVKRKRLTDKEKWFKEYEEASQERRMVMEIEREALQSAKQRRLIIKLEEERLYVYLFMDDPVKYPPPKEFDFGIQFKTPQEHGAAMFKYIDAKDPNKNPYPKKSVEAFLKSLHASYKAASTPPQAPGNPVQEQLPE